jgi:hypothetical protein
VVALKLRDEIQTRLPEIRKGPPASCNACHGSDAPTDGHVNYGDPQIELSFDFGDALGAQIDGSAIETAIGEALKSGALPPQVPSSDGDH